eukprot:jgi/Tetstr1/445070/TSEL_032875.t1
MACAKADELPPKIQRELAQYVERFNEWKKMCSVMNRLDKVLKEYMIGNNIDFIEDEGVRLSMAHPTRWMLDQSLIVDIDQYKVKKTINVLTVNVDEDQVGAKRMLIGGITAVGGGGILLYVAFRFLLIHSHVLFRLRVEREASKRVAEGDADYDRKGKRPAQPAAVEAPSRTIHAPEDGWLDKDGKVHRRHTADARILQRDLDDVFQIYDLLAPAEEPLRDLVEDGTDLPASSPASSAELFKTITAALALCTTVALRINKRGKKLHVEHEYGAEVAKEFDAVDPLGGKGSADYKELKKAIEKVKAKKPSSSSSREKPSSSSREPESFHRGSDDRREGGRREEKSPSGRSSAADITCYRCQRKGHFSRDCPSARR